jgi:hypothetical protein
MAHPYAEPLRTPARTRLNAPATIDAARELRHKGDDDTAERFILFRGKASWAGGGWFSGPLPAPVAPKDKSLNRRALGVRCTLSRCVEVSMS